MRRTPRIGKPGQSQTHSGPKKKAADSPKIYYKLNVGGQVFMTTSDTLKSLPNTRLGRLARNDAATTTASTTTTTTTTTTTNTSNKSQRQPQEKEIFFDRNPDIVNSVLDFYRTGELHLPKHLCETTIERELKFWEIPVDVVQECCFKRIVDHRDDAHITVEIDKFLTIPYETVAEMQTLSPVHMIWLIMERPKLCLSSKIWNTIYFTVVMLSVLFYCLETSMAFRDLKPGTYVLARKYNMSADAYIHRHNLKGKLQLSEPRAWVQDVQHIIFSFFLTEFIVRFFTCPDRRYFIREVKNWLDIFLLLQSGITIFVGEVVLRNRHLEGWSESESDALIFFFSLSVMRVFRIFYLAKCFDTMKILILSTKASIKVLGLLGICVVSLGTLFGASVFLAEMLTSEFTFSSIPMGMWYAIVTMTTVGYGDVVPISPVGKLMGMLCALCGVIVMALPIAVIASRFTTYHDNIPAREQMRHRLTYLKNHSGFCVKKDKEEEEEKEKDKGKRKRKRKKKAVVARHEHEKREEKNGEAKRHDHDEGRGGGGEFSCFRLCHLRRKNRKVKSHPVWVSEYKASSPCSASSSTSSSTPGGSDKACHSHTPSSVDDAMGHFCSQVEFVNRR